MRLSVLNHCLRISISVIAISLLSETFTRDDVVRCKTVLIDAFEPHEAEVPRQPHFDVGFVIEYGCVVQFANIYQVLFAFKHFTLPVFIMSLVISLLPDALHPQASLVPALLAYRFDR